MSAGDLERSAGRNEGRAASSPPNGEVHRLDPEYHFVGAHELDLSDVVSFMYPLLPLAGTHFLDILDTSRVGLSFPRERTPGERLMYDVRWLEDAERWTYPSNRLFA